MLLNCVCISVLKDEAVNSDQVRIALKFLATTHLSVRGWAELTMDMDSFVDDGESKIPLNSALLYLWEGVIPLVTAYCDTYNRLKESGPSSKMYARLLIARHMSVLWSFGQSVMVLCDIVARLL